MPFAIASPEIDIAFNCSPEQVAERYNLPLEKVQEYEKKLVSLLDGDDETFDAFIATTPLSDLL
jgi:hypothetical protein